MHAGREVRIWHRSPTKKPVSASPTARVVCSERHALRSGDEPVRDRPAALSKRHRARRWCVRRSRRADDRRLQEGPEPNGLGIVEASAAQAGNITLKASGAFVVHGTIDPWRDGDTRSIPTSIRTCSRSPRRRCSQRQRRWRARRHRGLCRRAQPSATDPLASWRRFGINLGGDTSRAPGVLADRPAPTGSRSPTRARSFEYAATGASTRRPAARRRLLRVDQQTRDTDARRRWASRRRQAALLDDDALAFYVGDRHGSTHAIRLAMPSAFAIAAVVVDCQRHAEASPSTTKTRPACTVMVAVRGCT